MTVTASDRATNVIRSVCKENNARNVSRVIWLSHSDGKLFPHSLISPGSHMSLWHPTPLMLPILGRDTGVRRHNDTMTKRGIRFDLVIFDRFTSMVYIWYKQENKKVAKLFALEYQLSLAPWCCVCKRLIKGLKREEWQHRGDLDRSECRSPVDISLWLSSHYGHYWH